MKALAFTIGLAALTLLVSGCAQRLPEESTDRSPRNFALTKTQPDNRAPFSFNPAGSFRLEFGRGSGRSGLDTIAIDETGRTVLYRFQQSSREAFSDSGVSQPFWETTEIRLSADSVQRVKRRIEAMRLVEMAREYHADVYDGAQWVFWLQQAGRQKTIYCNNHFPEVLREFASFLDAELQRAGLGNASWKRVPSGEARNHEKAIWKSIKD